MVIRVPDTLVPFYQDLTPPWPVSTWERIGYAGPIQSKMQLVVVEAHSKLPEVQTMPSTNSVISDPSLNDC
jgi:hypothetical protein